ncbi:MAG: serine hydrolase [bacterium]
MPLDVRAAGVSKSVVATVIMMLVEDGAIALDDAAADHLPASTIQGVPNGQTVTIRHLLNHTSGIPDAIRDPGYAMDYFNDPHTYWSDQETIAWTQTQAPLPAPSRGIWTSTVTARPSTPATSTTATTRHRAL